MSIEEKRSDDDETARIEAQVNESRAQLNNTLEAISDKLSPSQMVDEAMTMVKDQAQQMAPQMKRVARQLGRTVQQNPLPLALIAAGIAWFVIQSRQNRYAPGSYSDFEWDQDNMADGDAINESYSSLEDSDVGSLSSSDVSPSGASFSSATSTAAGNGGGIKKGVSGAVQRVRRTTNDLRDTVTHTASKAARMAHQRATQVGRGLQAAQHRTVQFYDESPLTAGAIALGVGVLIGTAIPLSRTERERLGTTAEQAARAVADMTERGVHAIRKNGSSNQDTQSASLAN
jgi:ElaB/YqjD/DUF883 family membrane-anchored ribosome-binding protein